MLVLNRRSFLAPLSWRTVTGKRKRKLTKIGAHCSGPALAGIQSFGMMGTGKRSWHVWLIECKFSHPQFSAFLDIIVLCDHTDQLLLNVSRCVGVLHTDLRVSFRHSSLLTKLFVRLGPNEVLAVPLRFCATLLTHVVRRCAHLPLKWMELVLLGFASTWY